jgi:hypothetical protein
LEGSADPPKACLNNENRGAAAEGMEETEGGGGMGSGGRTLAAGLLASETINNSS